MKATPAHDGVFKFFVRSAAVLLLLLTAGAKLYSVTGTVKILTATDPLIHLRYRTIMIGVGLIELAIALYLLKGKSARPKPWLVFWLSSNFLIYRFANDLLHIKLCPCLGTIASAIHLGKATQDYFLMLSLIYFLLGSTYFLLRDAASKPTELEPSSISDVDAAITLPSR